MVYRRDHHELVLPERLGNKVWVVRHGTFDESEAQPPVDHIPCERFRVGNPHSDCIVNRPAMIFPCDEGNDVLSDGERRADVDALAMPKRPFGYRFSRFEHETDDLLGIPV